MLLSKEIRVMLAKTTRSTKIFRDSSKNYRNLFTTKVFDARVAFKLADIGEGIREVAIKEWFVKVGDKVSQFDEICEVQSDKASVTITSRYDGTVEKLHYKVDDVALVGAPLIDIETESSAADDAKEESVKAPAEVPEKIEDVPLTRPPLEQSDIICIPSVRRLAKEHKLNLGKVKGTGKHGRILKEDVLKFLGTKTTPDQLVEAQDRVEPIKGFQKAMVKSMTDSLKIPHFVYSDEIKLTELSKLRKMIKSNPDYKEIKLSYMPFFLKAAANALKRFPVINSSLDQSAENIIYKSAINIGVAMDTKVGLAVPVIKNVDRLSIIEISNELARLINSGRNGTFSTSDLAGGTFSISNIGVIGGTYTKPVINAPQVAIIAIGSTQILPRFDNENNVVAEEIINVSAAADHRIIDGATMARFIQIMKKQMENPYLLFLNL